MVRRTVVLLMVPAIAAAAGCSGPRAGTSVVNALGGCAAALPLARATVHAHGTLVVVQRLRRTQADHVVREITAGAPIREVHAPSVEPSPRSSDPARVRPVPSGQPSPARSAAPRRRTVPRDCLIVWRGPYAPGDITVTQGPPAGSYAFVFVTVRHPRVTRVVLTGRLPRDVHG